MNSNNHNYNNTKNINKQKKKKNYITILDVYFTSLIKSILCIASDVYACRTETF